ncbi:MAG: transcriptional regulator [Gammaproteobacteria bacterium]|nr:MAG: transcriptional regulator [Gammaproteobacteria bacterium]
MRTTRQYTAPALEKGLEILELLAEEGRPMTLAQICQKLNRSKSELYRMLAVLERRGYLARQPGSDYFHITNRLFDLGMSVPPVGTLVEAAFPLMHELADRIQQPCHLAVVSAQRMVVVARVESPSNVGLSVRVGHSLYLFESSSGYILLAWMAESKRRELYDWFRAHCPQFDGRPEEAELAAIRERGYLRLPSRLADGVEDIGCPVFVGQHRHVLASLTVPYLKGRGARVPIETVIEELRAYAGRLSELAGSYGGF